MVNIACIIMASGLSKRFGSNKLLSDFNGHSLFENALDISQSVNFSQILTVTRYQEISNICARRGIPCLLHNLPFRNDTIRLGISDLLNFPGKTYELSTNPADDDAYMFTSKTMPLPPEAPSGIMFLPADQPLITQESMKNLCQVFSRRNDKICRLSYEDTAGSPVIFPAGLYHELLALPQGKGGGFLAKKYPEQVVLVPAQDKNELFDIDTPEDMHRISEYLFQKNPN